MIRSDGFAEFDCDVLSVDAPSLISELRLLFNEVVKVLFFGFDFLFDDFSKVRGSLLDVAAE